MTMRTILLPFYDDDVSQRAFELSAQLVRETNGYLEGLFVIRRPQILDGDGQMLADTHFTQLMEECRNAADRARARFEACAAEQGLAIEAVTASDGPAAGWREIEGMEEQVVGNHGRLFDVTVVGREFGRAWLNWRVIAESALFESGRPVLLTSQTPSATFGENVVIAWNASAESARAIAFSMPLLKRARNVTVLSVKGWGTPDPPGKDLAVYLSRAGVPATARTVDPHGLSAGETILDQCGRSGADLLVKGAYTQSRLRQLMFGGATRHILAHAHVPVVLAH
jgi:nucleotide-binding universal stress UspA family protein